jgi:2-methylcitrate dehydratase PrpD
VGDPVIQAMIPRTKVHQDTELYERVKNSMPGRVTVRLKDGREFTDEVLYPKGNPCNPMTEDEFKAKFMEMDARVLGDAQANELYKRARDLRSAADVADLAALFSPR